MNRVPHAAGIGFDPVHARHRSDPARRGDRRRGGRVASFALYEGLDVISTDAAVDMSLASTGAAAATVSLGYPLRDRLRSARDGMFVGLATIGGWFLLIAYALGQDTP